MKTLEKGVKSVNGVNRQFTRRSHMKTIVVVLFALLMWSHNTHAQCTLGATAADAGNSVSNSGGADFGQSFTACQTGTLDKIRILNNAATTNRTVSVRDGEGLAGTILGSVTGVNLNTAGTLTDYTEIDISGEGISVTNGNSYTIEITGGLTDPYFNASAGSIYAGGQIYFGGSANADFDMIFEVDIVTGGDTDPPVFENSTPSASAVAQTEFTLSTDIDEAGNIYFVVVVDGAGTPNSSEVKAGTGSGGSGQITAGNTTVNSGGFTHDFSVSGLSANTAYDVYTVAQDDEGTPNLQASPTKIDVTTAAPIALTVTGLTGDDKAYDGTTSATASGTAALSGVVGGDDVSLTGTPTYTFASANVGTGITITTTGYTLSGTDAGKYTLTQPTLSADITAVNLTVTGLTGNDKEYDGNTSATASGTAALSGVIGGDDVSISGSPTYTFASANVATGITITTTGYTLSGTDAGNYSLTQPTLSADITTKALTVTGLTGDDKEYDGNTTATASGTAALSGVVGGDDVSIGGSPTYTFASANIGTAITITTTGFTLSGTDAGNYSLTQPTLSADITTKALTVTGLTGDDKEYDGNTSATASGTAALSGIVGGDDVSIGGSPTYTFASANVGTGITITTTGYTLSGTDAGKYTLTQPTLSADITAVNLTVTGLTGNDKEYDGNTSATASGTAALSGVIGGDDVSISGSPTYTFASANVATGITITTTGFTLSGTDAGNYSLTQPTISADITTKALTVTGLTGDDKEYDGNTTATASGTAALSGVVGGDDVSIGGSPTYTFASANIGTAISITTTGFTISGTDAGNYSLTQPTLSADITTKALTVTGLTGDDKEYDGNTSATASGTAALSGIVGGDDVSIGGSPTYTFASANVGTGIAITTTGYTLSGTDAGKYTLTQPTLSADITAVNLTVTGLTGNDKEYDGNTSATASGTAALSGVIGGDDVSISGSPTYTFASANVATGITITTTGYTLSGTDAGNYSLTQPTLSADITTKALTVTGLTGDDKEYDGNTTATASGTAALSGVVGGDDVSIGGSPTYTFASANIGTAISITTTGFTISGTDAGNYSLTQPTLSADITTKALTVTGLTGDDKEYDGNTSATASGTAALSGIVGGDDVSIGGSPTYTFASANVGTGITITTTGYTLSGTDAGKYTLTQPTLSADITAVNLTVTGLTGNDKEYDGNTSATASGTAALSGVIGGDDVSISGSPTYTFASANVATGITITTTGYTLSGTDAGNYSLTQPTLSADITTKALTVTGLTGDDKEYDGNTTATASGTAALSDVVGGDDVSIGGSPTYTFASANIGTVITITTTGYTLSGTDAGNYSLTQPTLSADITTKALTVTGLTGDDKEYDGNTTATASGTAALSGIVGGDDVSIGGSPTYTFASANVGTGITITTTGFTLSGIDAGKYTLTQPTLSADITGANLTVTGLTGDDKTYDGTSSATAGGTAALSGVVGGDDVSLSGTPTHTFTSTDVGTGISITTTGYTLTGADAGKYSLTQPTLSADITAVDLTVTGLSGNNKTYDGGTSASASGTPSLSGIIGADDVSITGTPSYTFASVNVGTGISISTSGYALGGVDAGNYNLTQPSLSGDITAANLTVTGLTGDNKVYDGTTSASASGTPALSGVISGDDVSIGGSPTYTFASADLGADISITTTGFTLSGADAGNYTLTQPTLSADIVSPTVAFETTNGSGSESVDEEEITVVLNATMDDPVSVDYTLTGTASQGSDYSLANGTLTISSGNISNTITIADIVDDAIVETNETIIVTLSNPDNADLGTNTVYTYTIENNDAATVTITDNSIDEDDGTITLTATLDNAVQDGFTVDISTEDGTATVANNDYTAVSELTLTFAGTAGEEQTFDVSIGSDSQLESDEQFNVSMSNLQPSNLSIDISDEATVTINDDDEDMDSDGDGILDQDEDLNLNEDLEDDDTDGDGTPNYLDDDDDGDGISTLDEDFNRDGNYENDDSDNDGIPDYLDADAIPDETKIPQGISPDGDGANDIWRLPGIESHPDNKVTIFNRWGKIVYEVAGYNNSSNAFTGEANKGAVPGSGSLPDGTYYYVIDFGNGEVRKGFLLIK